MTDKRLAGTPLGSGWNPLDMRDDTDDLHFVPAPCQLACPIGTDAPSYIAYVWEGKLEEALEARRRGSRVKVTKPARAERADR